MAYHLKYSELIDKTKALFAEDQKILERVLSMIGYSPLQSLETKDEWEKAVRETEKKFRVVCRFLRDFTERNYVSRMKPFRSYTGILEAYDLVDRFMGEELGAITMEAVLAISQPGEKAPISNLMRMFIYDDRTNEKTALKRQVIFISALEEAKRFREAKKDWSSSEQSLAAYYSGWFYDIEISDMEKTDEMLEALRNENSYTWYLRSLIYSLVMQKFENTIFDPDYIKSDSWKRVWDRLKKVPSADGSAESGTLGNYVSGNEEIIRMIIKDALTQYHSGTLYTYHPMWLFGSRLYWDVLNDYLRMFQQDFELYQMKKMMEEA